MEDNKNPVEEQDSGRQSGLGRYLVLAIALIIGLVSAGLVIAASSSGDGKADPVASASPSVTDPVLAKKLKFSQCLRDHGFPTFPDPDRNGAILLSPSDPIDVSSAAYKAADEACKAFRPTGGAAPPPPPGQSGPDVGTYVACMKKNGMADFPDPDAHGFFSGIDLGSPAYKAAQKVCGKLLPGNAPKPPA